MARLFGTDGVRGLANVELTPELAMAIGVGAVTVLPVGAPNGRGGPRYAPVRRVAGGRGSAGLASAGADVISLGVVPTPAVAHAVAASGADLGIVLSASHNAMPDNGIKIFGSGGFKLPDDVEDQIEAFVVAPPKNRPTGAGVGRLRPDVPGPAGMVEAYVRHLLSVVKVPLGPLKVVVDCAEGAASLLAPRVLREAGAEVLARSAPTAMACVSTTVAARRPPLACRRPSSPPGPTWASPMTATPTAASRSTLEVNWSTVTRSWPSRHSPCVRQAGSLLTRSCPP